jgi:hypothetical protein
MHASWRRVWPAYRPRVVFEAGYSQGLESERPVLEELLRRGRVAPILAYSRSRTLQPADFADYANRGVPVVEASALRHKRFDCVVITDYPITPGWRTRRRTLLHHGSGFAIAGESYCIGLLREGVYDFLLALNDLEAKAAVPYVSAPDRQIAIVGQPKLDGLKAAIPTAHARNPAAPPTVLVTSHWTPQSLHCNVAESVLGYLATRTDLRVIVSGHPNLWRPEMGKTQGRDWRLLLAPLTVATHMELVTEQHRMLGLMQEADLLIGDKSSATLEFATLGRPIVQYQHPDVHPQPPEFHRMLLAAVDSFAGASDFVAAFEAGLSRVGSPTRPGQRELVEHCFPTLGEATRLAADAIESIAFTGKVSRSHDET